MKRNILSVIIAIMVLALVGLGAYFYVKGLLKGGEPGETASSTAAGAAAGGPPADNALSLPPVKSGAEPAAIAEIPEYKYTEVYEEENYGFSFKYPKDFAVYPMPADNSDVILVQNIPKNIGVQIVISPFDDGDIDVTAGVIKAQLPDIKITDAQELLVGPSRRGLAFRSDNQAFGGASREVWFVFKGHLYQISTYAELDGFLKGLFGTWQFGK